MIRGVRRGVGALAMMLVLVVGGVTAANADASGVSSWGGLTVNVKGQSVGIPGGTLYHEIKGKGKLITYTWANTAQFASGPICLWRIDFTFKSGGSVYSRSKGAHHSQCNWGNSAHRESGFRRQAARDGQACAQLYIDGRSKTEQCHWIYG